MDLLDLMWLAGLLEGEGSFLKGPPSQPHRPRISLQMTDKDVVEKAASLMKVGHKVRPNDRRNPKWKPIYQAVLSGKRAVHLMKSLKPYMGTRRRQQIDEAVACFVDKSKTVQVDTVYAIREAVKNNTQSTVAKKFGLTRETVNRIVNKKGRYKKI